MILVTLFMMGFQAVSQVGVSFGTVRTDGYEKITLGAFWKKRPEAKLVYNGSTPPGVEVVTLDKEYFVRFMEKENNGKDNNYIIFPKGSKIYYKNSRCFSAKCGNEIEFIKPVDDIIVQRVVDSLYINTVSHDTTYVYKTVYVESKQPPQSNEVTVAYNGGYQTPVYYQEMWCQPVLSSPLFSFCLGGQNYGGSNTTINNIDNSSYYSNNSYEDNSYTDNSRTIINPRPQPRPDPIDPVDPGGPVDPTGGNTGGPVDPRGGNIGGSPNDPRGGNTRGVQSRGVQTETKSAMSNQSEASGRSVRNYTPSVNSTRSIASNNQPRQSATNNTNKRSNPAGYVAPAQQGRSNNTNPDPSMNNRRSNNSPSVSNNSNRSNNNQSGYVRSEKSSPTNTRNNSYVAPNRNNNNSSPSRSSSYSAPARNASQSGVSFRGGNNRQSSSPARQSSRPSGNGQRSGRGR